MIDGQGREIDHLRLSLTDLCNLACRYCVAEGAAPDWQMIDRAFAFEVVRWLSQRHGIRYLRLTGGEPLLFPGLVPLVQRLTELDTLHEISLTTNGSALSHLAKPLHDAGLARINVSLDTLNAKRFAHITRGGNLEQTLRGIRAAVDAGLTPLKINVVAQRGFNDTELSELAYWGLSNGCTVRFLEVMSIGPLAHVVTEHLVPAAEILERLGERFEFRTMPQRLGQPSTDYAVSGDGVRGVIGVIAPTTRPFCDRCRRMRVTSKGVVVACLHDNKHFDLMPCWNGKHLDVDAADIILRRALDEKPAEGPRGQTLTMLNIGG